MYDAALVAQRHVGAREDIVRDGLPEHLDAQYVCYDLFRLAFDVRVDEGDVIVATYDVAEGR